MSTGKVPPFSSGDCSLACSNFWLTVFESGAFSLSWGAESPAEPVTHTHTHTASFQMSPQLGRSHARDGYTVPSSFPPPQPAPHTPLVPQSQRGIMCCTSPCSWTQLTAAPFHSKTRQYIHLCFLKFQLSKGQIKLLPSSLILILLLVHEKFLINYLWFEAMRIKFSFRLELRLP